MGPRQRQFLEKMPPAVKRQALIQLFRATAAAFQGDLPRLRGLSREQCLYAYARFTTDQAGAALTRGDDLVALSGRLYQNAYRLGRLPGWLLGVRRMDDVMALARILYGLLDIDLQGSDDGEVTITHCYFSDFYSPQVCQLMSAMDHGLLAGLAGGGNFAFTQRITEGQACCRAHFTTP